MRKTQSLKQVKRIASAALCAALVITSFVGCDKANTGGGASRSDKIQSEASSKLSMLHSGVDENSQAPTIIAIKKFKEQYKRDVEFITCGYDEWNQKVMASVASGAPIDVVNAGDSEYPYLAMKKVTMPVNNYIDLKNENIQENIMKALFSYKGEYYNVSPRGSASPLVIYYNKTLIENGGLEDPYELYQKDQWTTEAMKKMCMDFTEDTNGDGAYDRWGLSAWYRWAFMGSSAASVCTINKDGKYELNLDNNPPLMEAFELIQSAWNKDGWVGVEGGDIYSSFYSQKNLMLNEFSWAGNQIMEAKNKGIFAFDVGCVPFPYGKENTQKLNPCFADGFSILTGSDCPNSAGMLIEMVIAELVKKGEETKNSVPEQWRELYAKLSEKPFNSRYYDSAIGGASGITDKIAGGTNIQQAIETFRPKYKALIEEANKEPVLEVDHTFVPIEIDFSKGLNGIRKGSEAESLAIAQDADAVKITMNTDKYGEYCTAMETDPKVYPIYGFKKYLVTFEYKLEDIRNPELSCYSFKLFREGTDFPENYFYPDASAIGNFISTEVEIEGVSDSTEDLRLQLIGSYANTIWIKNLKVVEVK